MPSVAVLSDDLIDKIAAGEVVERPASVVKELCENAIDAGAKNVRLKLLNGGQSLIEVTDDGSGMSREDALLSVARHATSKLKTLDDLFEIRTLGFRGEALPSIASVSRLTLTTSEPGALVGSRVWVDEGRTFVSDAAPPGGTLAEVADLFFNTPARRKFLRRTSTELRHAEDAVLRLALAHPEVGFFIEHEGRNLLASPGRKDGLVDRIGAAIGTSVAEYLVPLEERRLGVEITGFVAEPEFFLATARGMYTFVNRRYVRDRGLNGAIQRAMQEFLPPGRHPVLIAFIQVDPRSVDVNVHPQKLEVRFSQGPLVYDALSAALMRALRSHRSSSTPGLDATSTPAHYEWAVERFLSQARQGRDSAAPLPFLFDAPGGEWATGFGRLRPGVNEAPPPGYFESLIPLAALGRRFALCEGHGATLVVIDPHSLRESVALNQLWGASAGPHAPQSSLFSTAVELTSEDAELIAPRRSALKRLGLEVEPFGGGQWAIRSVPLEWESRDWPDLLPRLLRQLPAGGESIERNEMLPALRLLACEEAKSSDAQWTLKDVSALLQELKNVDFTLAGIHRRIVVLEIPILELERRAGEPASKS